MPPLGPTADDVRRRILDEISGGALLAGERLGAERDMSERYGVSRSTLRAALDALESAGAVRRVPGRSGGTFVAERKVERDLTSLAGLPSYLRRQGFESGARVLSTTTAEADAETAAALAIPVGAVVFEIVRVRLADGEPISYERARFPAARFPGLLDHPLGGSLYSLLESVYGVLPGESEERIEIVGASATAARVLGVRRSAPIVRSPAARSTRRAVRSSCRTISSVPTASASSSAHARDGGTTGLVASSIQIVEPAH